MFAPYLLNLRKAAALTLSGMYSIPTRHSLKASARQKRGKGTRKKGGCFYLLSFDAKLFIFSGVLCSLTELYLACLAPCSVDTLLHVQKGCKKVTIHTVDTDVVVLALASE